MEKVACKAWTHGGQSKKIVAATCLEELIDKAQNKFGIAGTIYLQDGTEIDDEDGFEAVCTQSASPVFVLVPLGEDFNQTSPNSSQDIQPISDVSSESSSGDTIILESSTCSPSSALSSGSNATQAGEISWNDSDHIPLPQFSHMFRNSLKRKTQPLPVEKRGAAKAIADILVERKLSGRKAFRDMATRVVALSPDSFKNELGNGVHSFSRLIENAYFNHPSMRLNTKHSFRDKLNSGETRKRKGQPTKETYGCVQWQPDTLPDGETEESQKERQKTLKAEFSKLVQDHKKVETLMKETYVSQRFVINQKPVKPLLEIREDWPYLFLPSYFESHFYQLTGTTNEKFQSNLTSKEQTLYKFFSGTKHKGVIQTYKQQIEEAEKTVGNEQCRVIGTIFMLCEYFGEDKDMMLKEVEETTDLSRFRNDVSTPCLVYAGGSNPFLTQRLAITVDQTPIMYPTSILVGVKLLFMSFYVFNCTYPVQLQATLEYIQRMFFGINPERGTKATKSYRWNINPKVRSLVEKLIIFE